MEKLKDMFIMVRNPYKRIISEFNWQFRDTHPSEKPDINSWITKSLEQASSDLSYSDNHFRPSIDFIETNLPCKIFKLEDGIEFIAENFVREHGSINNFEIPNEKNAESFSNSISEPKLNDHSIAAINQFYQNDFEAFSYTIIESEMGTRGLETGSEHKNLEMEEKIKAIREWREITINTLHNKIQQELHLLDTRISQTKNAIDQAGSAKQLHNNKTQQSVEAGFDEILVKLKYGLLKLNLLGSPEQSITSSEISNMLQLANQYRHQARLKILLSSTEVDIKK